MAGMERAGRGAVVLIQCPCAASGNTAAALQTRPSSRRAGAGTAGRTVPRDGARLFMSQPWCCQPEPAHMLPLVYFSTPSCHPLFLSFPSSGSAWMWGNWKNTRSLLRNPPGMT